MKKINRTRLHFVVLLLISILVLFNLAASPGAKLASTARLSGSLTLPWTNVRAICSLSDVVFQSSSGTTYHGSVTNGLSDRSCNYSFSNVPSGTNGTLKAKVTAYSENTHIYTCWYGAKTLTVYWWSGATNITSWTNHSDSLVGSGICQGF